MQFKEANNKEHHQCTSTMIICRRHTLCSYLHCWCDIYFRHVCILAWPLLYAWLSVCVSCLPVCHVCLLECLWVCVSAWLPGCAGGDPGVVCIGWLVSTPQNWNENVSTHTSCFWRKTLDINRWQTLYVIFWKMTVMKRKKHRWKRVFSWF